MTTSSHDSVTARTVQDCIAEAKAKAGVSGATVTTALHLMLVEADAWPSVTILTALWTWGADTEMELALLKDRHARLRTDVALAARGALAPEEVRISHGIPDHEADALDPDVERAAAGQEAAQCADG